MSVRKQHVGYATATLLTVTPLAREVMIDTTKNTAVIGDGALAGGYPLAREDMSNVSGATDSAAGKMTIADKVQLFVVGDITGTDSLTFTMPAGMTGLNTGLRIRGRLVTAPTGAAMTITNGTFTKSVVGPDGLNPALGAMKGGVWYTFNYNNTSDKFEVENLGVPTAVMFQGVNYGLTGGTSSAFTLSTNATRNGWTISDILGFKLHAAPAVGATLAFEGFAAKPITINGGISLAGTEFSLGQQLIARVETTNLEVIGLITAAQTISNLLAFGKHTLPINGDAWQPRTTNGASTTTISQSVTNTVMTTGLDFSGTISQYAQFKFTAPKSWDAGTITFKVHMQTISGAGDVIWRLRAVALRDGVAVDTAFGSFVGTTAKTLSAVNTETITAESTAVTIANAPAKSDTIVLEISRDAANAADTHQGIVTLTRVDIFMTLNAQTDA